MNGFTLTKHGRAGEAKKRRFYVDPRAAALRWDSSRLADLLLSGERSVEIVSIIGVTMGFGTDLLRRKLGRGEVFGGHADRFFSLVTASRTIDLEAASAAQASILARAFRFLTASRNQPGVYGRGMR